MSEFTEGTAPTPTPTPAADANKRRRAVNVSRLSLHAPAPTAEGKTADLNWSVFEGNPRLVVYTSDPQEKENKEKSFGRIQVALDPPDVGLLMVYLKKVLANDTPNFKLGLKNLNSYNYKTNERYEGDPQHINDIVVGRDADGVIFIAAVEPDRPSIRFYFGPTKFHRPVKGDGSEFTKKELSEFYAESWIIMVPEVIAALVAADAIDRSNNPEEQAKWSGAPKREWNNNRQGGGGGNWNRGGGGGYNRGGGGGWNGNRGGGGGNWNRGGGGGGGGNWNRGGGGGNYGGGAPAGNGGADIADQDIQF